MPRKVTSGYKNIQFQVAETDWRRLRAAASLRGLGLETLMREVVRRLGQGRLDLPGVEEPIEIEEPLELAETVETG